MFCYYYWKSPSKLGCHSSMLSTLLQYGLTFAVFDENDNIKNPPKQSISTQYNGMIDDLINIKDDVVCTLQLGALNN